MNYLRYGPEIRLRGAGEKLAFGAVIKGQLWNYQGARELPEYDHEYLSLVLHGQYKFTPTSLFRVTLDGSTRRFNDRPSYDLDGQPRSGNPDLTYNYYRLELAARQRLFESLWIGFDIARTERVDLYEGYGDYARDEASVEVHWDPGRRFEFEAGGSYFLYDFPNAFAFNNPLAGPKTQEAVEGYAKANFRITRRLSAFAEARFHQTVSNDFRIQYDRAQYALGIRWDQ